MSLPTSAAAGRLTPLPSSTGGFLSFSFLGGAGACARSSSGSGSPPRVWMLLSSRRLSSRSRFSSLRQGLTLVHFSAQLEPCLTHTKTPYTP